MSEHPTLKPFWQMSSQFELCAESWSVLGVPMKYRHTFLETILPNNDEQTNLMNTFNQILRGRRGAFVFVSGSKDTGKTLLGSALVNSCGRWSCCYDRETERTFDYVPRFVSMQDLIDRITSYRSTKDWYNEYANVCRVLVIGAPRGQRRLRGHQQERGTASLSRGSWHLRVIRFCLRVQPSCCQRHFTVHWQ